MITTMPSGHTELEASTCSQLDAIGVVDDAVENGLGQSRVIISEPAL
jgi:hypothetical protein